jgi:aminomethyltransferase
MTSILAQTPLHAWHAAHGARMVDFAGWSMSVQYTSIVAEHNATRNAVGLFDVSHMARLRFHGDSTRFLDSLVTRRVTDMRVGQIRYALVTNDDGGILDDVLVYHLSDARGRSYHEMVVNAGNREKIVDWIEAHRPEGVEVQDRTLETAMIAVQGPQALPIVRPLSSVDPASLRYYHGAETQLAGHAATVSRTGYTGEDGCELIVPASAAMSVWEQLIEAATAVGGSAAGLGCRDTLRLEAGMPLYGHELNENIHPFQAGLDFAVNLEGRAFPGHDALVRLRGANYERRVGLTLDGKRVPREGYAVERDHQPVGRVTSGTFSPTLARPIAMAYLQPALAAPGTEVLVDIRSHRESARVVQLPFYRRKS